MVVKKGSKLLTEVVIILLIVLTGYLIYDKFKLSKPIPSDSSNEKVQTEIQVKEIVNYHHLSNPNIMNNPTYSYEIKIPSIIGPGANIESLNQKMATVILDQCDTNVAAIYESQRYESQAFNKGFKIYYEYLIKNNILIIFINQILPEGGEGNILMQSGDYWEASYYYDIQNDQILTVGEAAKKLNIKLDKVVIDEIDDGEDIVIEIKTYEDLEQNGFQLIVDNNQIKLLYHDVLHYRIYE